MPDPCSASIAGRKTGVPSDVLWPRPLRELLPPDQVRGEQALTPPRGSGSWLSWSLLSEAGPQGRLPAAKTMDALRRIGAAQSLRSGRSIAEQPRSGLTAMGQCGRQPEMCEGRSERGRGRGEGSVAYRNGRCLGHWRAGRAAARLRILGSLSPHPFPSPFGRGALLHPAIASLSSHSFAATASSRAAREGVAILRLAKYAPLIVATSGEEAR